MKHAIPLLLSASVFYAGCTGGGPAPDTTAPLLDQPSEIGTSYIVDPEFSFTSSEAGTLSWSGGCNSSPNPVVIGRNTVRLLGLADGEYSDCAISVTDAAGNVSVPLVLPSFSINYRLPASEVFLSDDKLQQCFDEHIVENGWQYADQVVELDCSNRKINSVDGLDILTGLKALNLANNMIFGFYNNDFLKSLESLNISHNPLNIYDSFGQQSLGDVLSLNTNLKHLDISSLEVYDLNFLPPPTVDDNGEYQGLESLVADDLISLDPIDFSRLADMRTLKKMSLAGNNMGSKVDDFIYSLPNIELLNLANNKIEYLDLSHLTRLKRIDASHNKLPKIYLYSDASLLELRLSGNELFEVREYEYLIAEYPALEVLAVSGIDFQHLTLRQILPAGIVEDGVSVSKLKVLEANNIYANELYLSSVLEHHSSLEQLAMSGWGVSDVDELQYFTKLTHLDISQNDVTSLQPILNLASQLKELNVAGNTDIPRKELKDLVGQALYLEHLNVSDIIFTGSDFPYPAVQYPSVIKSLVANNTQTKNSSFDYNLWSYESLEHLELAANGLEYLAYLPKLKHLNLADNNLLELTDYIDHEHGFDVLDLSGNKAFKSKDVESLVNYSLYLTELGISYIDFNGDGLWLTGPIEGVLKKLKADNINADLSGVNHHRSIEELSLAGNDLQDTSHLEGLVNLTKLKLADNNLVNLSYGLNLLDGLVDLDLSGNHMLEGRLVNELIANNPNLVSLNVSDISFFEEGLLLPENSYKLKRLYASRIKSEVPDVKSLYRLEELDLSGNDLSQGLELTLGVSYKKVYLADTHLNIDNSILSPLYRSGDLTALDLSGNPLLFSSEVNKIISSSPNLRWLGIRGLSYISAELISNLDLKALYAANTGLRSDEIGNLEKFEELDLSGNENAFANNYDLSHLINIKKLYLANIGLNSASDLLHLQQLEALDLSGNSQLSASEVNQLIDNNHKLEYLGVSDIDFSVAPLHIPAHLYTSQPQLKVLKANRVQSNQFSFGLLSNTEHLELAGNQIDWIDNNPGLNKLKVVNLADNNLVGLGGLLNSDRLVSLNIANNPDVNKAELSNLINSQWGLESLDISNIAFASGQLPLPNGVFSYRTMQTLRADNTQDQLDFSSILSNYAYLKSLSLAGNGVTGPLDYIPYMQSLVDIDLSNNQLVDLIYFDRFIELRNLDVSANPSLDCASLDTLLAANSLLQVQRPEHCQP